MEFKTSEVSSFDSADSVTALRQMIDRLQQLIAEIADGTVKCGEGAGWVARLDDGWDIDLQMTFPLAAKLGLCS